MIRRNYRCWPLNLLWATVYSRQTFEMSSNNSTKSSVSDDLVEAVRDRRQSDVDVDIRSHFRLHLRAQRQPTGCQQYRLSELVQQIVDLYSHR